MKRTTDLHDEEAEDYSGQADAREQCTSIYKDVVQGYVNKRQRNERTQEYWDIYNCKLGDNQSYSGDSKLYTPVVRDAIEARTLRFSNALFPSNGRFVECVSATSDMAQSHVALVNHYVRESRLRETVTAMLRAGDVSGQYSVYVGWQERKRTFRERVQSPVMLGLPGGAQVEMPASLAPPVTDVQEQTISKGTPDIWVIPDEDLCVLPATVDDIEDADIVAVALRVTKSWLRERKHQFRPKAYRAAMQKFDGTSEEHPDRRNPSKSRAEEAGIKIQGDVKTLLLYEVWTKLDLGGERVPATFLAMGPDEFLSIRKNPYWGQRCPVISAPVKKIAGSFWGPSPVGPVAQLQYQCNDALNMGMDAARYALMPIVMTDPKENPKISTMVLAMSAVWETNPNNTQIVKFPPLWQDALAIVSAAKSQIQESFGLNPAAMPGGGSGRKPSQAQVAQEQAVALEGISDSVRVLENFILTPLAQRIFEYDQQFRDEEMAVAHFGELGIEALLDRIPPVMQGSAYVFIWNGTLRNQGAQRIQQQIAFMNVLRGIPPQQLGGYELHIGPLLEAASDEIFGPRLAPRVLVHSPNGTPPATGGMPGVPGGIGAPGQGPGVAGTPRIGAMPAGPRGSAQSPPGAVHPDQMRDPGMMPRNM